jgi:DNA-binding GntR family transcriptional regulator
MTDESQLKTAEPWSLAERAYHAIRAMVLDLRLLPGQPVLVHELTEQLRMSRTPVREAIARLCQEGLLKRVSRKRVVVTVPTIEAMRETYEIIAGIEGQAAKLAAARADKATVKQLEESVTAMEAALAADDFVAWHEADRRFHRLLIEATGNKRMQDVMQLFQAQIHHVDLAALRLRPKTAQSVRDHRAVVDAIRARDGKKAGRVHLAHRERAIVEMERLYSEFLSLVLQVQIATNRDAPNKSSGEE